jgi:hypothetical protein
MKGADMSRVNMQQRLLGSTYTSRMCPSCNYGVRATSTLVHISSLGPGAGFQLSQIEIKQIPISESFKSSRCALSVVVTDSFNNEYYTGI